MRGMALAACALLAGCATYDSGVDVTRFHLEQPAARGTVFLEPAMLEDVGTLEFRTYASVVAAELRETGFDVTSDRMAAELLGTIDIAQASREALARRSPVTVGVGGGTGGRGGGIGIGTTFGLGGSGNDEVTETMLALRLLRLSDESVIWEGRAITESGDDTSVADVLPDLADALLRDYPGESGQTVTYSPSD